MDLVGRAGRVDPPPAIRVGLDQLLVRRADGLLQPAPSSSKRSLSPARAAASSGDRSSRNVRSGFSPRVANGSRARHPRCPARARRPGRRATSRGSGRTPRPCRCPAPAGSRSATSSERAAANSSASASGASSTDGSFSSSRSRSPAGVPPGSRTPERLVPERLSSSPAWVVLPERSMPSKVTNRPRILRGRN